METNIIVSRDICTLFALCFHPQPRGGPELLGASLLRVGALWSTSQSRSTAHWSKGQSMAAVLQGCRDGVLQGKVCSGSGCPQARIGAGRISVRAMERVGIGARFTAG